MLNPSAEVSNLAGISTLIFESIDAITTKAPLTVKLLFRLSNKLVGLYIFLEVHNVLDFDYLNMLIKKKSLKVIEIRQISFSLKTNPLQMISGNGNFFSKIEPAE